MSGPHLALFTVSGFVDVGGTASEFSVISLLTAIVTSVLSSVTCSMCPCSVSSAGFRASYSLWIDFRDPFQNTGS